MIVNGSVGSLDAMAHVSFLAVMSVISVISVDTLAFMAGANAHTFWHGQPSPGDIWTQCTVAFRYKGEDGKVTSRIAEPRRVFTSKSGNQLLLAWCPTIKEWKTFSCDSISDICTGGIALELIRKR